MWHYWIASRKLFSVQLLWAACLSFPLNNFKHPGFPLRGIILRSLSFLSVELFETACLSFPWCNAFWRWTLDSRKHGEDQDTIKWLWKCIKLVTLLWYIMTHGQQNVKFIKENTQLSTQTQRSDVLKQNTPTHKLEYYRQTNNLPKISLL
jgi:hypothetical protein